jgi:hypothetical protein
MNTLCQRLSLPQITIPENLHEINYHHVGGSLNTKAPNISEDLRWQTLLNKQQIRAIANDHEVWRAFAQLLTLSLAPTGVKRGLKTAEAYRRDGLKLL